MSAQHRRDDDDVTSEKKLLPLVSHRWAEVVISIGVVLAMIPFGFIAVAVAVVMVLLAWFV